MNFYPAIDLKGGRAVRLYKGLKDKETIYFENPLDAARLWKEKGAEWLHIVDLDAAFSGSREQTSIIRDIVKETGLKVQVGGGVRNTEAVELYLNEVGVARVVIGTAAYKDWDWFIEMTEKFKDQVTLGLDIKDGHVALKGWTTSGWTQNKALEKAGDLNLAAVLMTDVSRDGVMTGPNLEMLTAASKLLPGKIIASGGISKLDDIIALKPLDLDGIISGKAIYENVLSVEEAILAMSN